MPTLEEDLRNLEDGIRRLKIEYHIFFNGNRKKPPEDLRMRLERLTKQLSEHSGMTHAQHFRYTTLLTRYYTYRSLWRRILQEKERGLEVKKEIPVRSNTSPGKTPSAEKYRISLSDPKIEEDKVRSLYDALHRIKTENSDESPLPYSQFEKYITSQTQKFQNKYGCDRIAYVITLEGNKVRFTAAAEDL